jgi:thioredoxin-like negative regulator of GroEL
MVAIFFTSKVCPACQKMAPVIKKLIEDGYPIKIVDARNDTQLASQFKIEALPTLVILDDKKEVKRLIGVVSETEIRTILEKTSDYRIW